MSLMRLKTNTMDVAPQTYGIPSISKTLARSGHLSSSETASKRATDTAVLLSEMVLNPPTSSRAIGAIARMNQLHAPYQRAGLITNDGLLYTLSLFTLEPCRWVDAYEWRRLTELELCAVGTFWKSLGDAMKIDYSSLTSQGEGWRDGLHWLQELEAWSVAYEAINMVPADSNAALAQQTLTVLTASTPRPMKSYIKSLIVTLLSERLRVSTKYARLSLPSETDIKSLTRPTCTA